MCSKANIRSERGAELVEFALVLPLLLLLCLGVIEFGRAYYTYNILTKAVRDAVRYASAEDMTSTGVISSGTITNTKCLVCYGNIAGSGTTIVPSLQTSQVSVIANPDASGNPAAPISATEQYVMVKTAYPYSPLFSLVMPTTITFAPSVKMRFVGRIGFPS